MSFVVEFSPAARRQLKKLDSPIQKRIFHRIERLEKQPRPKSAKKPFSVVLNDDGEMLALDVATQ